MCVYTGTGDREGDSYQRVNVDDGTEAVGTVGRLVHQTTTLHAHLGHSLPHPYEGHYNCTYNLFVMTFFVCEDKFTK